MSLPSASSNTYPLGQCTWWACQRFYELTGLYIPWKGNAKDWTALAQQAGYSVSNTPHVGDIAVLQPGVQGADNVYGHVAVVEKVNADGTVTTSDQNWAGITYPHTTTVKFNVGPGISFINAGGSKGSGGIISSQGNGGDIGTGGDPNNGQVNGAPVSIQDSILQTLLAPVQQSIPFAVLLIVGLLLVVLGVILLSGKGLKDIPVKRIAEMSVL